MRSDQNGFPDPGELGIPDQVLNLRFRDGSIYQMGVTNYDGTGHFDEVFPFFKWLIAEVDFARFKSTGVTVITDAGGPIPGSAQSSQPDVLTLMPEFAGLDPVFRRWVGALNPQYQCTPDLTPPYSGCAENINPVTGNAWSRTEQGEVLLQAFQPYLGQTNVIYWGKADYAPGENGGITGVVVYAVTRAEDDPALAAAETWEPGIPRVQLNLYADGDVDNVPLGWSTGGAKGSEDIDWNGDGIYQAADGHIQDLNGDGVETEPDVDNYPLGNFPGPEDIDHNGNGVFDYGDAIQIVHSDSWDDNIPTGCPPNPAYANPTDANGNPNPNFGRQAPFWVNGDPNTPAEDCFEGLRTFNQVRDGVFDGGYEFNSYYPGGMANNHTNLVQGLPAATYIVEAKTPPGYEVVKEEDKNVDFGASYQPSTQLLPAGCVGHRAPRYPAKVPQYLTLFPQVPAPFAGQVRPLCDRKSVTVADGANAATDFHFFTEVPKAARIVGFILDDTANEFDPWSPAFGEKYAPPWIPISVRDWQGNEIMRDYSDQYGNYEILVPSTYSVNIPTPSGVSPNMLTVCLNSPGPIPNPAYDPVTNPNVPKTIIDPFFQRRYSQFCYTLQYTPGRTTYLDTPVIPVAAFAGPHQSQLDCDFPDQTPVIYSASLAGGNGPFIPDGTPVTGKIQFVSMGQTTVPNPAWNGTLTGQRTITRDYGFGATKGHVYIDGVEVPPSKVVTWTDGLVEVETGAFTKTGHVTIQRADSGLTTVMGITVTKGKPGELPLVVPPGGSIQAAIDAAHGGDLILVPPGEYDELVIMNKNVRLQGWGAPSVVINAFKNPAEKLNIWRNRIKAMIAPGTGDPGYILPGQEVNPGGQLAAAEGGVFITEQGAGITVLASDSPTNPDANFTNARIGGFTITGSDAAGGIFVNAHAHNLEIAGNRIINNAGFYSGGIRIGNPFLPDGNGGVLSSHNDHVRIHHNHVALNGSQDAAGGGISLFTGSDAYDVSENYVCGNFAGGFGGGIAHLGLSDGGVIHNNTVLFNQAFNQGKEASGGGIYIAGVRPAPALIPGTNPPQFNQPLGVGAGNVTVDSNLIQGNLAGAGDGGGICLQHVNGTDVGNAPANPAAWYKVDITNNMVVNNVAGLAGGGISLQDALRVNIVNDTIADNDSTATAGAAFSPGVPTDSNPQVAGVVARKHSPELLTALGATTTEPPYANPTLVNDIIWHNRSFYFHVDQATPQMPTGTTNPPQTNLCPAPAPGQPNTGFCLLQATPFYDDLGVVGIGGSLAPTSSILTDVTGLDPSNSNLDPTFVASYFNGDKNQVFIPEVTTALTALPAFDEGGNFIDVRFGPLTTHDPATGAPFGNYHLDAGSPAIDAADGTVLASIAGLATDIDGDSRPATAGGLPDIGADEASTAIGSTQIPDTDGDGVKDNVDNCLLVPNPSQLDSDGDKFGDACDGDFNNNRIVDLGDIYAFIRMIGRPVAAGDFNGNGIVDLGDIYAFIPMIGKAPGPSALVP